jgi:hypothetical protein
LFRFRELVVSLSPEFFGCFPGRQTGNRINIKEGHSVVPGESRRLIQDCRFGIP